MIIFKELSQIYIDPHLNYKTVSTIKEIRNGVEKLGPRGCSAELAGLALAIELMLPYTKRDLIPYTLINDGTSYDVAEHFKTPEVIVDIYLSTYAHCSNYLHKELDCSVEN